MKHKTRINHVYTYCKVRRKGKIDGRGYIWKFWPFIKEPRDARPPVDQADHAQFEKDILQAGEQDMKRLSELWEEKDRTLKTNYCLAKHNLKIAEDSFEKENKEAVDAKKSFEEISSRIHDLGFPGLSKGLMIFWLVLFGVVEIPLNYIVFQTLAEDYILTMILAAGLCAAIPFIAHYFGKAIKQEEKSYTEKILIIFIPIIVLAVLGFIAILRTSYFEVVAESVKAFHLNISPGTLTLLFVFINLIIFFVAVLVSYQGHHKKQSEFRNLKRRYKNAKVNLEKEAGEAKAAALALSKADTLYHRSKTEREGYHKEICRTAELVKSICKGYMEIYRTANIQHRKKAEKPECFKLKLMEIDVPKNLIEGSINWECANDNSKPFISLN